MQTISLSGQGQKKEHFKQIIDEENLDSPANSVEFLEYVKKHQQTVKNHQQRVSKCSKVLMCAGVAVLGFTAFKYFMHTRHSESGYGSKNHRLGASGEAADANAYAAFNYMSVAIWGLVVAKAKAGVEAATKEETSSVGSLVKRAGFFTALIAAASLCQFLSSMHSQAVAPVIGADAPTHKLQASALENHPASYYDQSSSHYMGGAHNVLLNLKASPETEETRPASYYDKSSSHYLGGAHNVMLSVASLPSAEAMGGNHNVAMAVLAEQSNNFKRARFEEERKNQSFFSMLASKSVSKEQFQKNVESTGAFVAFIFTLAVCIYFFVTLKTYHAHLEKQDQLTAILKNPNARVAAGKKGKKVINKL